MQGACHCRYVKGNEEPSLSDVRLLVVSLVVFAGFMHCDELLKLQCSDIAFGTESMTINSVFGMHSMRAGGATAEVRSDVAHRLFKRHGCWRSESAMDGYVNDMESAFWRPTLKTKWYALC